MAVFISIDIGLKSFTGVVMRGQTILHTCSRDLTTEGKDLPSVVNTLRGVCRDLLQRARSFILPSSARLPIGSRESLQILVEKQIGKFSFAQIESAVYMFFQEQNLSVIQLNPKNKLKAVIPDVVIAREFKKKYDFNKYQAKQMLDAFLTNTNQTVLIETRFKKDVADAVLQAIWYQQQSIQTTETDRADLSPIAEDDNELVGVSPSR